MEQNFNKKWSWFVSLRALAELEHKRTNEILEYPITEIYTLLEFEKDKANVAKQLMKR